MIPAPHTADVVIDGKLDEPIWCSAQRLTGFSLYQPTDQRPSPDSTDVLVWYSSNAIHLDTLEERRRAFVFIVNALGVQADGTKSEGGGFIAGSNVAPGQSDLGPDFQWQSRGHVDATQVAADPRFALFYAERRPFFVEGSDQFNVPNTLVYTRCIAQPDAALKLTGRLGRANISPLSALDATPAGALNDRPLVDILRLTRDFSQQSQAGFIYSQRVRNGMSNRLAGFDVS